MKYCSGCGSSISQRIPEGDNRDRHICDSCETVHYQNPCIITGCIPIYGDQVLLCRRAIEPAHGFWTLPAGFMENGETMSEGAMRECMEEANANLHSLELYTTIDIPHINQVYVFFRGHMREPKFSPGLESLDTVLFHEHEIPWTDLAFPSVKKALKHYFNDKRAGTFPVRTEAIRR